METLYKLSRLFSLTLFILSGIPSRSQTVEYLNASNVNAGFGIGGNLFTMLPDTLNTILIDTTGGWRLLEVPKGSGTSPVFTAALWMSGFDSTFGVPHCAAQRFRQGGRDYFNGPIVANYDSVYDNYYHRVFKITRTQIDQFRQLVFPVTISQVDSNILKWPGRGNPYVLSNYGVSITSPLAPFEDVDGDQLYNPLQGDYPKICGEEAVFFVFNDQRGYHTETGTANVLDFEIRGLAEIFPDSATLLTPYEKLARNNTVFVEYDIENKSQESYNDFYLSLFEDADLGCFTNDRVGCDTNRSLMFVYNEGLDPDCNAANGYGAMSVSHGVKFLNQPMNSYGYFTNGASFSQADPTNCMQNRYFMTGLWNDGTPFTVGGSGYNGSTPTKFLFPGDPNNATDWSDISAPLLAGDRRSAGSTGPMHYAQGEVKHFDFAFVTSYDSTSTNTHIIDTLKRDADIIQQFYNTQLAPCRQQLMTGLKEPGTENNLTAVIYPNPASTELNISLEGNQIELIRLFSADGKLLSELRQPTGNRIDISSLSAGIYFAEVTAQGQTMRKRWVKM